MNPRHSLPPIETPRLLLRPLTRSDLPTTLAWRNKDRVRSGFFTSRCLTPEEHAAWFEKYTRRDDDQVFLISDLATSRPVGQVALYRMSGEDAEFGRLMIGEDDSLGHGIAQEASQAILDFGFNALGLKRIYLDVLSNNDRARKLYLRLGFRIVSETADRIRMEFSKGSSIEAPRELKDIELLCSTYLEREESRPTWLRDLDTDPTSTYYRFFYEVTRTIRPKVCFEIGTCEGKSAAHLAAGNPAGLIVTLDIRTSARQSVDALRLPNIVSLLCDSIEATRQLRYLPEIDILFIDGDHRLEQSYREYLAYRPFVRNGGLIFFDDISINDEMKVMWNAIADPKCALPRLHYTGFGVAVKSPTSVVAPLDTILRGREAR